MKGSRDQGSEGSRFARGRRGALKVLVWGWGDGQHVFPQISEISQIRVGRRAAMGRAHKFAGRASISGLGFPDGTTKVTEFIARLIATKSR